MRIRIKALSAVLVAAAVLTGLLSGCGAVGVVQTAAGVTYQATKATVKAAGKATKWTYNGARKVVRKVRGTEDEPQSENTYDQAERTSTSSIHLPNVVERP